jgi:hypothetical protein
MICCRDPVNTAGHFLARALYIYAALQVLGVAENSVTKPVKHQILECVPISSALATMGISVSEIEAN